MNQVASETFWERRQHSELKLLSIGLFKIGICCQYVIEFEGAFCGMVCGHMSIDFVISPFAPNFNKQEFPDS